MSQAFYTNRPFVLTRGKKAMAAVVGIDTFRKMVKLLEKHDPGLADSLAISANPEIETILEKSDNDIAAGRTSPIEEILKDS